MSPEQVRREGQEGQLQEGSSSVTVPAAIVGG